MSLADGQTGKKCTLDHRGLERSKALPQIAIPALSPRGTEEQGMTADANGDQEIWPNQEIYRNSQISDYFQIPPLSDWGSRGPGVKSRQPYSMGLTHLVDRSYENVSWVSLEWKASNSLGRTPRVSLPTPWGQALLRERPTSQTSGHGACCH